LFKYYYIFVIGFLILIFFPTPFNDDEFTNGNISINTNKIYSKATTLLSEILSPEAPTYVTDNLATTLTSIVDYAKQFLGTRYQYGGTNLSTGVDCSGFTQQVMKKYGILINRTAASQSTQGTLVTRGELMPGDLIFFNTDNNMVDIDHVGMFIGNGEFIHASSSKSKVVISNLASYGNFVTAKRFITAPILNDSNAQASRLSGSVDSSLIWKLPIRGRGDVEVASLYGYRSNPRPKMHAGWDLAAPLRTDIYSIGSGVVTFSGDKGDYGNTVIVKHDIGNNKLVDLIYAHLDSTSVRVGDTVTNSTVVGKLGSTGSSTGPHLHIQMQDTGNYAFDHTYNVFSVLFRIPMKIVDFEDKTGYKVRRDLSGFSANSQWENRRINLDTLYD